MRPLKMILAGAYATPGGRRPLPRRSRGDREAPAPTISCRSTTIGEAAGLAFFEAAGSSPAAASDQQLDGTLGRRGRAARLAEQLACGIAEAHRLGIVHRDLRPGNILLAADGTPKITDFGVAKAVGSESGLTRSESILGSPSYMERRSRQGAGPRRLARRPISMRWEQSCMSC